MPDERHFDDPMVESEDPEKVLQIKNLVSALSIRWFKSEYFYSFVDKVFYTENELVDTVQESGMPFQLNKREWSIVRQSFSNDAAKQKGSGRPRRLFSAQFIED